MVLLHITLLLCEGIWIQSFRSIGLGGEVRYHGLQGHQTSPPDFTPLDFFLWGYVKNYVFSVEIQSLSHMKERIKQAIEAVSTETLEKVWKNINSRINHIIRVNGGHIEQDNIWTKLLEYLYHNTH